MSWKENKDYSQANIWQKSKEIKFWEFPGGPAVRTLVDMGSIPGQSENWDTTSHASQPKKKNVLSWPKTLRLDIKPSKVEFKIAGTHSVCEEQDLNPTAQPRRGV